MDFLGKMAARRPKLFAEIVDYTVNFLYLAGFLSLFTWYRRLVLAEYQISYLNYGISIVQALIISKVILVGDAVGLGRRLDDKPLVFPTLYKTIIFGALVGVFDLAERTAGGLLRGGGLEAGLHEITSKGGHEVLARVLVILFAFIPFFAFKELGRVMGEGKITELFFRRKAK